MDKKDIRKNVLEKLSKLSGVKRKEIEQKMQHTLFTSDDWLNAQTLGVTIHQEGVEWETATIIEQAWKDNKTVAVPKCIHKDRSMEFYDFRSYDELEVVYFNLKEPIPRKERLLHKNDIDLLLVPGVVYDNRGYRIGFGGGYYDRFLVDFPNKTVSLASEIQFIDEVPNKEYDIPVQEIITENGFAKINYSS